MNEVYPSSLLANDAYNWLFEEECNKSVTWTKDENKQFEKALAIFDEKRADRWFRIAEMIPGKTVVDVKRQYEMLIVDVTDIEAGLVPIPGYSSRVSSSPFTFEMGDHNNAINSNGSCYRFDPFRKVSRPFEHERKKGVPWTEDEHRRFLLGLQKHGKGDWRNISRNFVISKTPTQVASHAQKYFLRQNSGIKDKRRPSIHDITTANVPDVASQAVSEHDNKQSSFTSLQKSINIMPKMLLDWSNSEPFMVFNSHGRQNQDLIRQH